MNEFPFLNEIKGLSMEDARLRVEQFNFKIRPVNIDGQNMMRTMDIDNKRINVKIVGGKITQVLNLG